VHKTGLETARKQAKKRKGANMASTPSKSEIKQALKDNMRELKSLGSRTQDPSRQISDATDALCQFQYLRPSVGVLPGTSSHLLKLEGTVQMMYQGHGYFVPLAVYLRDEHPASPPICVVTPTPEMTIKPNHRHVDVAGIVYLPYLHEWTKKSNLIDAIKAISAVFTSDPFIYKKPSQPAQSSSHTSSSSGSRTQPPYASANGATPTMQSTKPPPPYGSTGTVTRTPDRPVPTVDKAMSKQLSTSMMSKAREMEELDSVLENSFRCPISMEIMVDPVFAADGHTYERAEMERWLNSKSTSPLTNEVLPHKMLVPNHNLRSQIKEYVEKHPNAR